MAIASSTSLVLPAAPPDNRFRILLLEDDAEFAAQLLGHLARTGFDCHHASEFVAGQHLFADLQPHLLLCEANSAGMDGLAFCKWVREASGVPVVMMGAGQESSEIAALKTGADDYLALPLRPAALMARVVAHLRRAYRYNAPPKVYENPFGLPVEDEESTGALAPGWAACDLCGHQAPRAQFEKEDLWGNIKMVCPNCKSSEHVVISID